MGKAADRGLRYRAHVVENVGAECGTRGVKAATCCCGEKHAVVVKATCCCGGGFVWFRVRGVCLRVEGCRSSRALEKEAHGDIPLFTRVESQTKRVSDKSELPTPASDYSG